MKKARYNILLQESTYVSEELTSTASTGGIAGRLSMVFTTYSSFSDSPFHRTVPEL